MGNIQIGNNSLVGEIAVDPNTGNTLIYTDDTNGWTEVSIQESLEVRVEKLEALVKRLLEQLAPEIRV